MNRLRWAMALSALFLVVVASSVAQDTLGDIANSHIEANVPKGELFDQYLNRDLNRHFCDGQNDCRVEYEFLRKGATQTGVSYPKFYLWVKCFSNGKVKTEGAVRVAAVEQKYFDITNYLSTREIIDSPDGVGRIFPAALVEDIQQRARR